MSNPEDPPPPEDPAAPVDAATTEELYGTPRVDAATADALSEPPPDLNDAVNAPTSRSTLVDSDEPVLASTVDIREAVGAPSKKAKPAEPDEPDAARRSRRTMTIAALAIITGLIVATMIFLGRANSQRYLITCTTDQVRAEQGRAFPPWGSQLLGGAEYKPIALPANAECKALETDDIAELDRQYLSVLLERASTTLTAPQLDAPGKPLDVVERQLHQALLLTRAPERRDQRKEVERLLGDVQYWRASLRLRDASVALSDAAKQFDAAAAQRPRHVTDAAAWASFLKRLTEDIKAGPNGVPAVTAPMATTTPTTTTSSAAPGTALPVEPEPDAQPPATTPDAGVPTGGVLL